MVIVISVPRATSAAEPADAAPSFRAASRAWGTTSQARTACPFLMMFPIMGCPMVPVPMNPTRMVIDLRCAARAAYASPDGSAGNAGDRAGDGAAEGAVRNHRRMLAGAAGD